MEELNIPLCRAKKIDSDEYLIGYVMPHSNYHNELLDVYMHTFRKVTYAELMSGKNSMDIASLKRIDPSTLSIHFPDMIASDSNRLLNGEKDLRIFASLNGNGGDMISDGEFEYHLVFDGRDYILESVKYRNEKIGDLDNWNDFKIVGIQK
jgi:hypothetical protein